jgi:hypothetical protein
MPPKTNSDDFYPGTGDKSEKSNVSDAGPIADPRIKQVPTWDPTAPTKDAALVRIDPANLPGGDYSTDGADDSNPAKLQATGGGAFLSSEQLLTGSRATGLDADEKR